MAWERTMGWNILLLITAMVALFLLAADELGKPIHASNLAQRIAPKLGVPEARLTEELINDTLFRLQTWRIMMKIVPLCILAALLAARMILERGMIQNKGGVRGALRETSGNSPRAP